MWWPTGGLDQAERRMVEEGPVLGVGERHSREEGGSTIYRRQFCCLILEAVGMQRSRIKDSFR